MSVTHVTGGYILFIYSQTDVQIDTQTVKHKLLFILNIYKLLSNLYFCKNLTRSFCWRQKQI